MMLSAGENPAWIARQMGHADWGMIRRTYARWMPDVEPNAGEKASSWWAENTAQNLSKPVTKKSPSHAQTGPKVTKIWSQLIFDYLIYN